LVIKNLEDEAAKKGVPDQKYEVVKEEMEVDCSN
jgi:hypothetical protein